MGCWNKTCMISNLHIRHGQEVAVFLIGAKEDSDSYCYSTSYFHPCLVPFYAKYDDYGGGEECSGIGLPYIIDAFKQNLKELDVGENKVHDIAVRRKDFDDKILFEADHEGRLFFETYMGAEQVSAVMVHKDIFDHIINSWTVETYVSRKTKTISFADIVADIPEYLARYREVTKDKAAMMRGLVGRGLDNLFKYEEPNLAGKYLKFSSYSELSSFIVNPATILAEHGSTMTDQQITEFLIEALKGVWINSFLSYTRRCWIRPTGEGSQNDEHDGHRTLIAAITKVLDAENKQYAEENEEYDDEEC